MWLPTRFIYVATILDAWPRLVVGYAIGRSIDARLTAATLQAATACIHHSDRGSQYASEAYRQVLADADLLRSMGSQQGKSMR
ncbi:DDE-type integrase/transposase/recombinase [Mesorhizobium sp. M1409]|uniref:DDE-type integrase/transposase/recombinase n=1 Tax=unclassified Mesorhizobium TaxID=325217 RepID=UPI003339AB02